MVKEIKEYWKNSKQLHYHYLKNDEGNIHGFCKYFLKDGRLKDIIILKNGIRHGIQKHWSLHPYNIISFNIKNNNIDHGINIKIYLNE